MTPAPAPQRAILHLDLDAFFCCVEELHDPSLVGRPFAVGGTPSGRGVVASCSYAARAFGVRSAMPMAQALRLVPSLIVRPTRFDAYRAYSQRVMAILHDLTPMVEQLSIDEAFLDVTGLKGTPREIALQLQRRIRQELNLPASLGAASNKLVAKIANNRGKAAQMNGHTPSAIEVVAPGEEAAYLAPLPVNELWGIGAKTEQRLALLGIHTIGQLASTNLALLQHHFGKHGYDMWNRANARDNRPVETEHDTKSISAETTFARDVNNAQQIHQTIEQLAQRVVRRLRRAELQGTTIKIKLRHHDFTTLTRQLSITAPTSDEQIIVDHALTLLHQAWIDKTPLRLVGVGVSNLTTAERQLGLFDPPQARETTKVARLMDDLQDKYGQSAFRRARDLQDKS